MNTYLKIAKRIISRSQIKKNCIVKEGKCCLMIEESIYLQEQSYCFLNLRNDIAGFSYDVNRELEPITGFLCDEDAIQLRVEKESNLFTLTFECEVAYNDETIEKIKMNEWVIKE